MFKFRDCLTDSSVFNEALIKRFEENWKPSNDCSLWMIPGHIIYSCSKRIYTCDARPLDLLSPVEPKCGDELTAISAPIVNVTFDVENNAPRMYIVLRNGDIQIFEYRALLYEWARVGYFNVNIVSPNNTNTSDLYINKVLITSHHNMVYWLEKTDGTDLSFKLFRRSLPNHTVREITQSAIGTPQLLLKNCPDMELIEVSSNMCIVPLLPNSVNIYIVLSARSHLWLFDISGKCLWTGIITEAPVDFLSLCMKTAGLWSRRGMIKVCKLVDATKCAAYILHEHTLLSITANGEISNKVDFDLKIDNSSEYYVLRNVLCVSLNELYKIYSMEDGKLIQTINVSEHGLVKGMWTCVSSLPGLGFYTDSKIFQLQYESLSSICNSNMSNFSKVLSLLSQDNLHFFAVLRDLVKNDFNLSDVQPLKNIPTAVQSKAILLALIQSCKEKGYKAENLPFCTKDIEKILSIENDSIYPETKLKNLLEPLVDCYLKLEKAKQQL